MENEQKGFFKRTAEVLGFTAPAPAETRAVGGPALGVIPPARSTHGFITVDQALSLPAVYRSVSIIVSSVSQMDLGVYRDGVEIPTPTLIKRPNLDSTRRAFIKATVWSLATDGNAYWRVQGNPVANLEVLDPNAVTVINDDGKIKYAVNGKDVPAKNIKHLRLETRPGTLIGYGPLQHGQNELISALRLKTFGEEWFGAGGVPNGILTTDQMLNGDQAAAFAQAWNDFIANNGTAVLSQGMRYEYLNIKPAEAQYLEISQSKTVSIARLFGVPPSLLASGSEGTSNTYMNQQELYMQFLQTTLVDYMNEIEDALSSILPRGQDVNFKEETLLRMNTVMETEVAVAQVNAGLITPNEWRASKGLAPLSGSNPNPNNGSEENGTD